MAGGKSKGSAEVPADRLVKCQYYLDPQHPDLTQPNLDDLDDKYLAAFNESPLNNFARGDHVEFKDDVTELLEPFKKRTGHDRDVWRCRRLTEPEDDGPATCPFHTDPAERRMSDEDLAQIFLALIRDQRAESAFLQAYIDEYLADEYENADEFLRIVPPTPVPGEQTAITSHSTATARRRKMFCGAQFGTFDLSNEEFNSPDRYPIDLQGATVAEMNWERAVVGSEIRANSIEQSHTDGEIRLSGADVAGPIQFEGVVAKGKVSVSESDVNGGISFRHAALRSQVSLRSATVTGDIILVNSVVGGEVLLHRVTVDGKISLSKIFADKVTLTQGDVGTKVSLYRGSIKGDVSVLQSTIETDVNLHGAAVHGRMSLHRTTVKDNVNLTDALVYGRASLVETTTRTVTFDEVTIHGQLDLSKASVDEFALKSGASVGRSLLCEGTMADRITISNPCINGALDFTGLRAEHLDISPPVPSKRHPAIRAVCLRDCQIERITPVVMPSGDPDDTIVYDFQGGAVGAIEKPTDIPEGWTLYDFFRFVETDFPGFDFSFHRDGLHQNGWNLHGLKPGRERDVQIVQRFETGENGDDDATTIVEGVANRLSEDDFLATLRPDDDSGGDMDQSLGDNAPATPRSQVNGHEMVANAEVRPDQTSALPEVNERGHRREGLPKPARQRIDAEAAAADQWIRAWLADEGCPSLPDEMRRAWNEALPEQVRRQRGQAGTDRKTTEQIIEESRVLSIADRLCTMGPLAPSIDRGPVTVALNQLEATYARAKTAADAVGENQAASAFFRKEQRYIQLQNRRHLREEVARLRSEGGKSDLPRYGVAWAENASLRLLTKYGESPRRVLSWWLGIIFIWSILYYAVALVETGTTTTGEMWTLLVSHGFRFILLSIGSFATLIPAGTVLPDEASLTQTETIVNSPVITLLSEVEALLGVLFLSLFVLTLTRSIHR